MQWVGFSSCVLHGFGLRDLRWRVVFGMSDSENSLLMALGQFVIIFDSWGKGKGKVLDSFTLLPFSYFYFYIFVT